MTRPPGPRRPSLLVTVLKVVAALLGLILAARLVPAAIRSLAAGGRAVAGVAQLTWWIVGALAGAALIVVLLVRRQGRRRSHQGDQPPSGLN